MEKMSIVTGDAPCVRDGMHRARGVENRAGVARERPPASVRAVTHVAIQRASARRAVHTPLGSVGLRWAPLGSVGLRWGYDTLKWVWGGYSNVCGGDTLMCVGLFRFRVPPTVNATPPALYVGVF